MHFLFILQIMEECLGEHGWYGSKWMYEESMQIPLNYQFRIITKFSKLIPQSSTKSRYCTDYFGICQSKTSEYQGNHLKPY
jgi:hypothetical protein